MVVAVVVSDVALVVVVEPAALTPLQQWQQVVAKHGVGVVARW
jgi:hypothetical protein